MVKRLKRMMQKAENKPEEPVIACTKVDIGSGTLVDESIINQLCRACDSGPGKFARALLRHVFSEEELRGKSLFGGKSCVRGETRQKEALDPVRVEAVIGYTCTKFPGVSVPYLKNSLSSLLSREIK
ncbi:uncharacterized protein [Dermacentor albipictus]|uniref:uncharacterized protein n=1 Tax=Dermacentor albipictus TaxID=60249 RepID=UPI0038FC69C6